MRRILLAAGAGCLALLLVIGAQTLLYGSAPSHRARPIAAAPVEGAAERLAGAIRIATISPENSVDFDGRAFAAFHNYLNREFPRVHAALKRETVSGYSLLYTWLGRSSNLDAILFAGHLDVVPVEPSTRHKWRHDPFSGAIAEGFVWGRGAIDNKSTVMGTLESVERLLAEGFIPERTIYLAFGHDEEVGGVGGARNISRLLKKRGVRLDVVLDEGGVIADGTIPGIDRPIALVGIAEKGFVTVELTARVTGGHSSLPPRETAIGIVSAAVTKLERHQMDARFEGPTRELFEKIGPEFPLVQRAIFANLWLTKPLITRTLQRNATTNAMIRTTTAPTLFQAGTKDNVLPAEARAVVNFRTLPGDTVEKVVAHVRDVVHDARISVKTAGRFSAEPSRVSETDSEPYALLERTIGQVDPDALVAPYLVVVVTDARYYAELGLNIFRFLPLRLVAADLPRMHGIDERLEVTEYNRAIRTYRELMRVWGSRTGTRPAAL